MSEPIVNLIYLLAG